MKRDRMSQSRSRTPNGSNSSIGYNFTAKEWAMLNEDTNVIRNENVNVIRNMPPQVISNEIKNTISKNSPCCIIL